MQLITFTTKGDDSYEENGEVEEDDHERTNREILLEVEENEKSSLGEIYIDFPKSLWCCCDERLSAYFEKIMAMWC
jgi:hypothetical protein